MHDIWSMLCDDFDFTLPRMNAITIKEDDYDLGFYAPSHDGRIGYTFLDTNQTVYNQDRYTFEMYFAAYEYPNLCNGPGKSRFLFTEQKYRPGQIEHEFHFPNSALAGREKLSAVDRALNWSFELCNTSLPLPDPTHIYRYSKKLYSLFISHDGFTAKKDDDGVICIKLTNHEYHIASNMPTTIHVFDNEMDAYEAMGEDFCTGEGHGRVMVIETVLDIDVNETVPLKFGMSHHSRDEALRALALSDADEYLKNKWNTWFESLPAVSIADEREEKLYYKSWWTIRLNYCKYPGWGFNVLESLPVYKGIWQWAIPAVEWHSSQDPQHMSEWIRRAMDILLNAQRDDGYVTHAALLHEEKPGTLWLNRHIIQNPQLPGTALRYYNVTGDLESLKRWYPSLKKYYDYLCESFDKCHKDYHLWAAHSSFDTGLDTFPSYQQVTYGINGNPPTEYCYGATLSAERYHYERSMGRLSQLTGLGDKDAWDAEAELTKSAINRILWDEKKHWYGVEQASGELDTRVGIDGLFPLIYGLADDTQLSQLKPQFSRLIGEYGIRTCAEGEPEFFSDIYWRGPCWPKSCSLAIGIAHKYFPDLKEKVFDAVLNFGLKFPNTWECMDVGTGKLARGNIGFYCTPCMSSNVGAGELLGAIWMHHGMDMFGTDKCLTLVPMKDYHYCGLLITVCKDSDGYSISAKAAEKKESDVEFVLGDYRTILHLEDGKTQKCRI